MLSLCFYNRRGFKLIRRLRMKEDKFYLNFFPYQKTYTLKSDRIISIFIYEGMIENADIIVEKRYGLDIIEKILGSESTFDMIKHQQVSFHNDNKNCLINLLKIYNILKKYPSNIRDNILIMGSCILTTYGLRKFNDIDIYVRDSRIKSDVTLINLFSRLESIKLRVDITTEKMVKYSRPYWTNWKIEWARLAGIDNFNDILDNPNYHFYFCGMKFMSINIDIARRLKRSRVNAYVDLIMIKKNILPKLKLWSLPEYEITFNDKKIVSGNIEYSQIVRYGEQIKYVYFKKINKKKFHHSLRRAFKIRYHTHMNIEDIINIIPKKTTIIKYVR